MKNRKKNRKLCFYRRKILVILLSVAKNSLKNICDCFIRPRTLNERSKLAIVTGSVMKIHKAIQTFENKLIGHKIHKTRRVYPSIRHSFTLHLFEKICILITQVFVRVHRIFPRVPLSLVEPVLTLALYFQ